MPEDQRLNEIRRLLHSYVKSPSLRHIREPHFIGKLAQEILRAVDRKPGPWQKWEDAREAILMAAASTWIPTEDLCVYLNGLPGPKLTTTDVAQRLRAMHEEPHNSYPDTELQESCLRIYNRERELGTEMIAIIGELQEFVEAEKGRIDIERETRWREAQKIERENMRQRLLSGIDCKWTAFDQSNVVFCRVNGRLYRLCQGKDKRWSLSRVKTVEDTDADLLGVYAGRREATKVIQAIAFQPERNW